MPAGDKSDFLVPGGALSSRLMGRMLDAIELTDPVRQRHGVESDDAARVGSRIGPYLLLRLLGSGGMGAVYLAEHTQSEVTRQVALKVLRAGAFDRGARERFALERRILARLAHPNIAPLYDSGETDAHELYYTMEYVDGVELTTYCREQSTRVAERVRLLLQVASALSCAHRSLIVHRDIKPSNVLVDRTGRVKLLDFGIAKPLAGHDGAVTVDATGPMTPQYAAPEQFRGDPLTVATDVYQFGVLTFKVLTGRLPFRADASDPLAWGRAVSEQEPLSLRAALRLETSEPAAPDRPAAWSAQTKLDRVSRSLGADLDAIVRKALMKDPAQRYVSVDAMSADLEAWLAERPVQARRAGRFYRVRRWLVRNRAVALVALVAVVALAAQAGFAVNRLRAERDRAESAAQRASATTSFLTSLFAVSDPAENRGEKLTANQILERGARQLETAQSTDPSVGAAVALEIGNVYVALGEQKRAVAVLTRALDAAEARLPPDTPLRTRLLTVRGWSEYLTGDYVAAERDYARAAATLPGLGDASEREFEAAVIARRRATLARRRGNLAEASTLAHASLDALTRLRGADDVEVGRSWNELGIIERDRGDHAASIAAFQHAIAIYRERLGAGHPNTLGSTGNLAEILMFDDRDAEAEALIVDLIARQRALQEGPSTMVANDLNLLSQIRLDQKRYAEAAALAAESDDMYRILLGPEHNYRAFPLVHLGHARLGLNDGPGALAAFTQALNLRRKAFGEEHADTANALKNLGDAQLKLGHPDEAERLLRQALTIRAKVLAPGHVNVPRTRLALAQALLALQRTADARAEIDRAARELEAARDVGAADREALAQLRAKL